MIRLIQPVRPTNRKHAVVLLGFLLGLLVGLLGLSWYYIRLNIKLKRLIRQLHPEMLKLSFSSTSKLTRAIAASISEQKILAHQLEIWQQINQVAPIGFIQVDQENRLIECNPVACAMLHIHDCSAIQPRPLLELVRSYELDQVIEQTRLRHQPCQQEWTFYPTSPDPSLLSQQVSYPLRAHSIPLPDQQVGVFLENRQEAMSLAQQRDRWISDVAHELKTPLTSIRLVAETLQLRLDSPYRDWLDRLHKEVIRLSSLVQDLLDLSQLEAHPTPRLNIKVFDMVRLIQSTWLSLEPLARCKFLKLDYQGLDSISIEADESRWHRALLNLLDNSIKYSSAHQTIQVRIHVLSGSDQSCQLHLEVIDSGPGFPELALPHVFDRFYRVDPSRTRNHPSLQISVSGSERSPDSSSNTSMNMGATDNAMPTVANSGSGLGLAIVRQIVEVHGGVVTASNHPETGGAWVQVFLPLSEHLHVS